MLCDQQGGHLVQIIQHEQTAWYFVLSWFDSEGNLHFLQPDVCGDYFRYGRLFLHADELLAGHREALDGEGRALGFFVPAPAMEFIYYLLKKIDKQELDHRHGAHLTARWREDPVGARSQIRRFWVSREAGELANAAERNDWSLVGSDLPRFRRALRRRLPSQWRYGWREFKRKVGRVLRPTGFWVVFLGPDGSGKTSATARVSEMLLPAFRRKECVHLRPRLGISRRPGDAVPVAAPHKGPPRGNAGSMAKLLYYVLDYGLGYWFKLRPLLVRSTILVFDRYYHDLFVDPLRYRYGGPMWLARWVGKLIPKPDLWIFLDAPAEVLQARKQEVSFEESARQRGAYLRLVQGMNNSVVVDASRPLDDVVREVNMRILDLMAARTARRLGLPDGDPRNVQ